MAKKKSAKKKKSTKKKKTAKKKDNSRSKVKTSFKNITNREFLLGDFDKDNIKNIDDPRPWTKSSKSVEETKLSTPLTKSEKLHKQKAKVMERVIKDFRKLISQEKNIKNKKEIEKRTPYRAKTPISVINKAYKLGVEKIEDFLGVTYLGDSYEDLKNMARQIEKNNLYQLKRKDDYYKTYNNGYKAIHLDVIHNKSRELIEVQLKTKRIKKIAQLNHKLYKEGKSNPKKFGQLIDLAEHADSGDQKARTKFDSMTNKQIVKILSSK